MAGGIIIMRYPTKTSVGYMLVTSLVGIVLGLVMLLYPGGTMSLMRAGFWVFQVILTIFILYYTLSEAVHFFRSQHTFRAVTYVAIGAIFTALIWILDVSLIYYAVAFFLGVIGVTELIGAFYVPVGKFFLALLGMIDLMVGIIILLNPVILAYLIAWYVLFWGVSRLLLSLELRKALR